MLQCHAYAHVRRSARRNIVLKSRSKSSRQAMNDQPIRWREQRSQASGFHAPRAVQIMPLTKYTYPSTHARTVGTRARPAAPQIKTNNQERREIKSTPQHRHAPFTVKVRQNSTWSRPLREKNQSGTDQPSRPSLYKFPPLLLRQLLPPPSYETTTSRRPRSTYRTMSSIASSTNSHGYDTAVRRQSRITTTTTTCIHPDQPIASPASFPRLDISSPPDLNMV